MAFQRILSALSMNGVVLLLPQGEKQAQVQGSVIPSLGLLVSPCTYTV